MPPKLTAPPRTATPLFRVLRTRALALFVSALLAPLLASTVSAFPQQTSSAPQSDQPPPIQRERRLLENHFVAVERITLPPTNAAYREPFAFPPASEPPRVLSLLFHAAAQLADHAAGQPAAASAAWRFANASFSSNAAAHITIPPSPAASCLVNIYLKDQPPLAPFADDAVKLDPRHNQVLFENSSVRVVRIFFAPGESGPLVDKRPRVIIVLTDSHASVTLPDSHSEIRDAKAAAVYFGNPGRQATNNIGTTPLENIVVELKTK